MIYPLFQAAAEYSKNYTGAWALFGAGIGAGLAVVGAGLGIGRIGGSNAEAAARQPEMANRIFISSIVFAGLIEGAALFAVVLWFVTQNKVFTN